MRFHLKTSLQSALLTVLTLFGGIAAGVVVGNVVFETLPGHSVANPSALHIALAAIPAITGLLAGSAAWGLAMGRFASAPNRRRMALAGVLGFAPVTIVVAVALLQLEAIASQAFGAGLPVHRVFTLLFVPAAGLIAGVSAWAVGLGLGSRALALSLLWRVGVSAGLAFLAVNLAMEASGWVVGAPRAAERFTMLTVMFAGNLGAALAGGAALGWALTASQLRPATPATQVAAHG